MRPVYETTKTTAIERQKHRKKRKEHKEKSFNFKNEIIYKDCGYKRLRE